MTFYSYCIIMRGNVNFVSDFLCIYLPNLNDGKVPFLLFQSELIFTPSVLDTFLLFLKKY